MALKGGRYRVVQTKKGPVRLHFNEESDVDEAKNTKTGATHSREEFEADRKKRKRK